MDLSDGSRLLKTFNLNKALESLSCNEDSNAVDSIYTKSTTCETSNQYSYTQSIFGESLLQTIESPLLDINKVELNFQASGPQKDRKLAITLLENYEKSSGEGSDIKPLKVCFFDEDWLDINTNLNYTVQEMLKHCLDLYKAKNYKRNPGVFYNIYDIYNQEIGLIQDLTAQIWTLPSDTYFIKRSPRNEVVLRVHF